jgi:hypothetical protein
MNYKYIAIINKVSQQVFAAAQKMDAIQVNAYS